MQARGLSYRKPHTLRHTYESLLLVDGVSMTYVKQLGHHSMQVTVDINGHLVPQSETY